MCRPSLFFLLSVSWVVISTCTRCRLSSFVIVTSLQVTPRMKTQMKKDDTRSITFNNIPIKSILSPNNLDYNENSSSDCESDSVHRNFLNDHGKSKSSKPYLELIHPQTNTTIILLGCLHGASSSANDVSNVLNASPTDVIVLELCPTRYKDLVKLMTVKEKSRLIDEDMITSRTMDDMNNENNPSGDYINMVSKTIKYEGVSTGIAAAVLGGASGLSSVFSGFEAGLEFITAIQYVQKKNDKQCPNNYNSEMKMTYPQPKTSCDIILGDQIVDETLKRVGSLPTISSNMCKEFIQEKFNWSETYGKDSVILSDAIVGDEILKRKGLQIELSRVLFRNKDVIFDLFRSLLPFFLFIQIVTIITMLVNDGSANAIENTIVDLAPILTMSDWMYLIYDIVIEILMSALIVFVGYISLALPSVRIILSERDGQLTNAIHAACRVAKEKRNKSRSTSSTRNIDCTSTESNARVVAILGLLHVNGVAKRLLIEEEKERNRVLT